MSRSKPNITNNPCSWWLEWDGKEGNLRYYDKDKKQNIPVSVPFTFMWIENLTKITGWSDRDKAGIYSNEVRNLFDEVLTVKVYGGGVIAQGYSAEIKDAVKARGGKFTASVYIGYKDNDELKLGNISFKGAALNAWINFFNDKKTEAHQSAITIASYEEGQKGSVSYRVPVFKLHEASDEMNAQAIELSDTFEDYLSKLPVKVSPKEEQSEQADNEQFDNENTVDDQVDDDLPF